MSDRTDDLLPRVPVSAKTGDEPFRTTGGDAGFTLRDFWRWSASDLVSNAWRGVLAEILPTRALDQALPTQKTLGLSSLLALDPAEVPFEGIAGAVRAAAQANLLAPRPDV